MNNFKKNFSGSLHDATGDHFAGFYIAGTLILISGLILLLLPLVVHYQQKRKYDIEPANKADSQPALVGSIGAVHLALVWQMGLVPRDVTMDKLPERNMAKLSLSFKEALSVPAPVECL